MNVISAHWRLPHVLTFTWLHWLNSEREAYCRYYVLDVREGYWKSCVYKWKHFPSSSQVTDVTADAKLCSLRKQPTFREVATWDLAKRRLINECRNSILMTCTIQILVVLLIGWKKIPSLHIQSEVLPRSGWCTHQYWISASVTQTSFCEGSSGDLANRRLFSQAQNCANNKNIGRPVTKRNIRDI